MKFNLYKSMTKFSHIHAIFWSTMGLFLILFPTLALGGAVYMIAIYFTLLGVLRLIDLAAAKTKDRGSQIAGFIPGVLLIITGAVPMFFLRYIRPMTPLYVAAMLAAVSIIYFILASCLPHSNARGLHIAISLFACIASAVAVAFSFGFGIDGSNGFARIAGITAALLGIDAIIVYLRNKKFAAFVVESEA